MGIDLSQVALEGTELGWPGHTQRAGLAPDPDFTLTRAALS